MTGLGENSVVFSRSVCDLAIQYVVNSEGWPDGEILSWIAGGGLIKVESILSSKE